MGSRAQKFGKISKIAAFTLSPLLLVGCNYAAHYESAANVGKSRVEMTPLFSHSDDSALAPVLKAVPATRKKAIQAKTVTAAYAPAHKPRQSRLFADVKAPAAAGDTVQTMQPLEPSIPVDRSDNTRKQTGGTVEQKVAYGTTWDKGIVALEDAFAKHNGSYRTTQQIHDTLSAKCRLVLANTGINTAILRSPTLSANVDTDENYGIGISYDFVDLKRADLQEELALARCYHIAISVKIQQLLVSSSQALTRSGFLAKANMLRKARPVLARYRRQIAQALRTGNLTETRAAILRQYIDQMRSNEAKARGEASKRELVDRMLNRGFRNLDAQLATAERRIHDIQARIRTASAITLRGEVNYGGATDIGINGTDHSSRNGELSGTLKVAVRLGAFSERRHQLEEVARRARVDVLSERDSGVLWRTKELAKANDRGLKALYAVRRDILAGIKQAQRNTKRVPTAFEEDLFMPRMRARIDVLILRADLAGVNATIADTKRINAKLRFKQ
ncbi:MAG: hypothetical protein AAF903_08575 [Pseudomonadota bacterium]